jgi:hypothetical protein
MVATGDRRWMALGVNILFPSGYRLELSKLHQQLDQTHYAWWQEWKAQQEFKIDNIRFNHDPNWDKRFFSLQSAHNANHWFWKATRVVWMGMGGAV